MKAINIFLNHPSINGNKHQASKLLGVSHQKISYWTTKQGSNADLPVDLFVKASEIIGVHPCDLRPDIFRRKTSDVIAQVFEVEPEPTGV